MANEKSTPDELGPLASLNKDALDRLDKMDVELDAAERQLNAMEEIGVDVSRLRERVAWARKAKQVILGNFGTSGK